MLKRLLTWWRRAITVTRTEPEGSLITLVHGDGRIQSWGLSRNNTCNFAYVCQRMEAKRMRDITVTLVIPGSHGEPPEVQSMEVPDWARRGLYRGILKVAKEFGWQGETYQPRVTSPFR